LYPPSFRGFPSAAIRSRESNRVGIVPPSKFRPSRIRLTS